MNFNIYLPWYMNVVFLVLVFITLLWQAYYWQILFNVSTKQKLRTFFVEGLIVSLLVLLAYRVEHNYSYVLFVLALPLIWWHIGENYKNFQKNVYDDINYNTYKQAWDSLPVPVAIANDKYEIILLNESMYSFIATHLHRKIRSVKKLWESLELSAGDSYSVTKEAGRMVLQEKNGTIYWAELESFSLEGKNYWQLTLTDILQQDMLLHKERVRNIMDEERQGLVRLLNNFEEIKRQEVAEELHGRLHDFMGQRIAILQRLLSEKDNLDCAQLYPLLENVLQDMRTASFQSNEQQLQNIIDSFTCMGIRLNVKGKLPQKEE